MTVLVDVPSQQYTPLARTLNFSVNAAATRMLLTFEVLWAGVSQGVGTIGGGVRNDKGGSPIVGDVVTTFGVNKPPGLTSGSVRVTSLQTLTTAILVETF